MLDDCRNSKCNRPSLRLALLCYPTASLEVEFFGAPGFEAVDAEIQLTDGSTRSVERAKVSGSRVTLLSETDISEEQVQVVTLSPVAEK